MRKRIVPEARPSSDAKPRRWTIIAAGFLLLALSLVVIYTSRSAFFSPVALVVVAAIGLAAVLLQFRVRRDLASPGRAPLWLNALGILLALASVFADVLRLSAAVSEVAALGAVGCFSVSGAILLNALRGNRSASK